MELERDDRYLAPGTPVRLGGLIDENGEESASEFGVIVHCWKSEELSGPYDCYVAFFGNEQPVGQPSERPYVLRYAASSLVPLERT